jgi:hypothetical protein
VLQRLVDRGQHGAGLLSLARVRDIAVRLPVMVALLVLELPAQALEVEVAQGIGAQAAALEVLVAGDVGVPLQLVRNPAEDVVLEAIGVEALEQQQRLERGVRGDASIHPPVRVGRWGLRYGSQRGSWERLRGAVGHGTARGRWARWSGG